MFCHQYSDLPMVKITTRYLLWLYNTLEWLLKIGGKSNFSFIFFILAKQSGLNRVAILFAFVTEENVQLT